MVRIYTTNSCHYCKVTKEYLKSKNIPFEERSIMEYRAETQKIMEATGALSVPLIDIDGKYVVGFDRIKLNELLDL